MGTKLLGPTRQARSVTLVVSTTMVIGIVVVLALANRAFAQDGGGPPAPPPGAIGDSLASLESKLDLVIAQLDGQGDGLSSLQQSFEDLSEGQGTLSGALDSLLGAATTVAPFQAKANCTIGVDTDAGDDNCSAVIPVPSDKLLIIEHVSATGSNVVEEDETVSVWIQTRAGGSFAAHPLGSFTVEDRDDLVRREALSISLRLYADPGSGVMFAVNSEHESHTQFFFDLTGQLVDAPETPE